MFVIPFKFPKIAVMFEFTYYIVEEIIIYWIGRVLKKELISETDYIFFFTLAKQVSKEAVR
jgi:hypothetical protein